MSTKEAIASAIPNQSGPTGAALQRVQRCLHLSTPGSAPCICRRLEDPNALPRLETTVEFTSRETQSGGWPKTSRRIKNQEKAFSIEKVSDYEMDYA